jgi:cation-transporting ATPase E
MVVAGQGIMRAEKVGQASYSSQLTAAAKKFQRASSELITDTNRLLKWISWLLILVTPLLIFGQLRVDEAGWRDSIVHTVAAIVGMIPEGLVLLTSATFMLAAIHLARKKVLVQQMPAVETLARVDSLLLDKTGTLTEGKIGFENSLVEPNEASDKVNQILAAIAGRATSPTNQALTMALKKVKPAKFSREVPFSSARKWSALMVNSDSYIFGAPEVILAAQQSTAFAHQAADLASQGKRVLVLVRAATFPVDNQIPTPLTPVATVILSEKIRSDAAKTLGFFAKQKVAIKIISGDSPLTVAAVARAVKLGNVKEFDARNLPDADAEPQQFATIVNQHNVFGRVQPAQKRQIAAVLQSEQHVVAMTGDGVNDALALKKADLGIAMESGASATKAVAELVLLDNKFSHLPNVLSEGRRVIANIERVANLFVIKNVYSLVLALAVTVAGLTYPYLPIQMTVISTLSIGVPAFFLALAPNNRLYRPGFLRRVLSFAIPIGVMAAVAMMVNYYLVHQHGVDSLAAGTSVSIVVMMISITVLVVLARPLKGWKLGLIMACGLGFVAILLLPPLSKVFSYALDWTTLPVTLTIGLVGVVLVLVTKKIDDKITTSKN